MINFDFLNSTDFSTNVNERFIYNFYESNESEPGKDVKIINNNINPTRFIELDITTKAKYDRNKHTRYNNLINFINLIDLNSLTYPLTLDNNNLNFFNKLHDRNKDYIDVVFDKKDKEINKINNFFNIQSSDFSEAVDFMKLNHKASINKVIKDNFYENNNNSVFFTQDLTQSINIFENLLQKNEQDGVNRDQSEIRITENFVPFQRHSMFGFDTCYYKYVGHLVEKYKIDEILDEPVFKSSSFFKSNEREESSTSTNIYKINDRLVIKDNNVVYGSTYFYIIYPTFLMSIPSKNDYNTIDTFLVCDYPYITDQIECKETIRPEAPSFMKIDLINDNLRIKWNKPVDMQGDIKGYQIFKRDSLENPYKIIHQIEFHSSFDLYERNVQVDDDIVEKVDNHKTVFIDKDFKKEIIQIYTICSIDARGFTSNYGTQIAVVFDSKQRKCIIDTVSKAGAPLHMPNLLLPRKTKFFNNDDYIVSNTPFEEKVKKISVFATPECFSFEKDETYIKLLKGNYKLGIFSLENGQKLSNEININGFEFEE